MKKSIWFILLLISVYASAAYSAIEKLSGYPNDIWRPISTRHVDILLKRGITKIGKLNLKKLSKELNTVEWRTFEYGFLRGSGGNRTTSIYLVKERMVVINTLALENLLGKPIHVFSWMLHEGLGALGYSDENYELSASISFLAENPLLASKSSIEYVQDHFQIIARSKVDRLYATSGGSTVVGGGGDAIIIELKQLLLKRYFEWIKINRNELTEEEIKKGFNSLIKFKMEIFNQGFLDFNKISFWLEGQTFYLDSGAIMILEQVYKVETLDIILDALKDFL